MKKSQKYIFYCWPNMFVEQPGLGHMKEIVRTLILEAQLTNRVALLPPLLSNLEHNPNFKKNLHWDHYYDWSNLSVNDPKLINRNELKKVIETFPSKKILLEETETDLKTLEEDLIVRFFSTPNIFGEWIDNRNTIEPNQLKEPSFSENYPEQVWKNASEVIDEIGIPKGVIHIRRGDLACPETDPKAVSLYLKNKGVKGNDRVLAITNEKSLDYYKKVRMYFPEVVFEQEVNALQYLDNYKVFRIGKCIQSRFDSLGLGSLRFMKSIPKQKTSMISRVFAKIFSASLIVSSDWIEKFIE